MTQIATRNDAPKPALRAGGPIAGIVPQSMEEAFRLSVAIHQANMAPYGLDAPEKIMIAMMAGLELEIPPMQAVQSIAIINNRPCMWGDALIGVVRKSQLCLYVREWIDGDGDARIARCETKRKGEEHPVVRSFSVDDAKRAKLWSTDAMVTKRAKGGGTYEKENDSPWYRYPQRMLQMRARAWCLRDTYADVLKGMQVREEVEDYGFDPTSNHIGSVGARRSQARIVYNTPKLQHHAEVGPNVSEGGETESVDVTAYEDVTEHAAGSSASDQPIDGAHEPAPDPEQQPATPADLLHAYSAALLGAEDQDELAARHDGFEGLRGADKTTLDAARSMYRLHLHRATGRISRDIFNAEVKALLEGEMA